MREVPDMISEYVRDQLILMYRDQGLGENSEGVVDLVGWRSPEGDSLLHIAAIRGDDFAVRAFVQAGIDVNSRGEFGLTPLHYAVALKRHATKTVLLELGADPSALSDSGIQAIDNHLG